MSKELYYRGYVIDMQRRDNGQQFETNLSAKSRDIAAMKANELFPESTVLCVWEQNHVADPSSEHLYK